MKENIFVLTASDKLISLEAWQKIYGLHAHHLQIGKWFHADEPKFQQDLKDYGTLVVSELLIRVADRTRELWGRPLHVNSFNRNEAKQEALRASGARAATTSPHVVFLAMDIDTKHFDDSRKLAAVIIQAGKELNIKVRVGFKQYIQAGQTFVHFDVCPEYYAQGKSRYNKPHPAPWEVAITW
jgi:hypothetical protein